MMQFWLTRFLRPAPLAPGLVASAVIHAAIITCGVVGTMPDPDAPPPELPANSIARFLVPPNRTARQEAQREQIRYLTLAAPEAIVVNVPKVAVAGVVEPRVSGLDQFDAPPRQELGGADSVFSIVEVDSAASRYEWSAAPAYPPALLASGQGGFVRAEWVVNEQGVADTSTLHIVEASHPEFAKAVRDALPFMRFRPARIGTRPVSQLVQQPFYFQVTIIQADTGKRRKPIL